MAQCVYVYKRGPNKGKTCGETVEPTQTLCRKHAGDRLINILEANKKTTKRIQEDILRDRILALQTTIENKAVIMRHFYNMKRLDINSSEYYKNQMFVDACLSFPWNSQFNVQKIVESTGVRAFIKYLQSHLDNEIYGMESVKNEIINVVCKLITNPNANRNNIALYGKAGIAKSKIIKVLSDVLGIPMKTISLGGIKDSSFFLGHGYVYVESGPGKILQNIIDSKVNNPIVYFDELDKVSETSNGTDIYSFLCYLTDPTQNNEFTDHYFYGMKFDLSKVLYVFTFNDISKVNPVLLDRLNVIYVSPPCEADTVYILQRYSVPEILKNIGIQQPFRLEDASVISVMSFCKDYIDFNVSSGIREYYRVIEKVFLEINKCLLLQTSHFGPDDYTISNAKFSEFFDKVKTQFLHINDNTSFSNMYM
ncbi:AAA family ATPase [bacterium]|nr:AAA family ATPase [bacterium]NDC94172.1 AAA family ATPase [bacterium]NDD82770.1 AAA family ATPase [bacterium]NDG29421.1 AAA family ATPase [bacterium]